jgi:hypothetical protein
MKTLISLFLLLYGVALGVEFKAPKEGQTAAQVLEFLGDPIGTIELREKTLLLYPRGEITLKNGLVTSVDLMQSAEFEAAQEILRQEREDWLLRQERNAIKQKALGEALRAEKLQSTAFAALPAKDRVDFWRRFQIQYPQIDVEAEVVAALESYQVELKELKSQQRIAELEKRVAEAEKEAATARMETEKLRQETEQLKRKRTYGLRYYTESPIPNHRYYYRPPTVTIFSNGNRTVQTFTGSTPHAPYAPVTRPLSNKHPVETILNLID